ncbi:MAG: cyclic nucleotide-binding domain-containing protein, partial [SAR324 cluster bacterium]|nr:cyclic nucleotide-binding domain-containing protein [SAR324 cluster bacterium]
CRLFRVKPGEYVINKGDISSWMYVVLKGGCFAYIEKDDRIPINHLKPGDIVGELTAIMGLPRTAFIVANFDEPETLLVGIDFSVFSNVQDSRMDLSSKILVFQVIQRTIFKRLRSVENELSQRGINPIHPSPALETPPHYMSQKDQLREYMVNSSAGAASLMILSDQLSNYLN